MSDPAENRKIWLKAAEENRALLDGRVKNDIEKYRKRPCKLRFIGADGKPLKNIKVRINQTSHDFGFGANIFMLDEFDNEEYNRRYRGEFKKYFNLATVPFYWDGLEPEEGKPRYDKNSPKVWRRPSPELCTEYCEEKGIMPKLHCLVYDKFIPEWLPRGDMREMERLYEERFRQISERFAGRLLEFEVINELLCEQGWSYKSAISSKRDIIEWAFALARKYFPNDTLIINEGNPLVDLSRAKYRSSFFMMVENAIKSGAGIDKLGLQHHIFTGATCKTEEAYENAVRCGDPMVDPAKILKGLDVIAELGLPLEMTEVTLPTFGETEEDEELQADLIELLYSVWFSHPAMQDIVYWNVPDGYAYDDGSGDWNENKCRGGLWHHDLTPKKSALRLHTLINEVWHTDLEAVTDESGYIEFRGFYGGYTASGKDFTAEFGIHKDGSAVNEIIL